MEILNVNLNCLDIDTNGNIGINIQNSNCLPQTEIFEVRNGNIYISSDNDSAGLLMFGDKNNDPGGNNCTAYPSNFSSFEAGDQTHSGNSQGYRLRYILPTQPPSDTNDALIVDSIYSPDNNSYKIYLKWGCSCSDGRTGSGFQGIINDSIQNEISALNNTINQQQQTINNLSSQLQQVKSQINQLAGNSSSNCNQIATQSQVIASLSIVPNPSSGTTTICYSLSMPVAGAQLIICNASNGITDMLYNLSGNTSGNIVINGGNLSPGTYRCSIVAGNQVFASENMILIK